MPTQLNFKEPLIAIMNSGGIRSSIDVGNITLADLLGVLPFSNTVDIITMTGEGLKIVLEESASKLSRDGLSSKGGFLQVSGIFFGYFIYNILNTSSLLV